MRSILDIPELCHSAGQQPAGLYLLFHSWIGLIASGVLVLRIRDEESLLHSEFGPEWEEYCRTSWRLLPLIY